MFYPLCQEITYTDPFEIAGIFQQEPGTLFLDSAKLMPQCGRYSFLAVSPFKIIESDNPFACLDEALTRYQLLPHPGLPPFQGGIAGYFSYDLLHRLEKVSASQIDDMQFPDAILGFYDLVIAFDLEEKKSWIFSSGFPFLEKNQRKGHAKNRLEWLLSRLESKRDAKILPDLNCKIVSNFTQEKYCAAVLKVKNYILAGDIFEANISQRFKTNLPQDVTAFDLYSRLREMNPATFSAYFFMNNIAIASASPERFLKVTNKQIETRPIKGTRSRGKTPEEDKRLAQELLASEKDRAENVMIVDLLRNDLSRVCEDHSVQVPILCGLESYATVHHLVSVVTGKLNASCSLVDLLRATFPGGSITGAPKIRAMEIIAEIEPTKRGPYCGSIGYLGFNGMMDTSITIRTLAIKDNEVTFQAGGAIVLDSDPEEEFEETLVKARALIKVLSAKKIHDSINR